MKIKKSLQRLAGVSLSLLLSLTPLTAQTKRVPSPPQRTPAKPAVKEPVPTFDTLLAAESYKIYGEVRGVGQLIRSQGMNDLLDPIMKLAGPPKEFRTIVKWLEGQAESLMSSRLMFASWPTRPDLPKALVAIEFGSPEEARQFEPKLRSFLPKVIATPSPSPHPSPSGPEKENAVTQSKTDEQPQPPYVIKQSGSLVVISDSQFTFKNLRPKGRKLMGEDQNFRLVHDRFTSEPIFLYFDVALEDRAVPKPTPTPEAVAAVHIETPETERSERTVNSEPSNADEFTVTTEVKGTGALVTPPPEGTITGEAKTTSVVASTQTDPTKPDSAPASGPSSGDMAFTHLYRLLLGSRPSWPEVIGAAVAFDDDAYVLRAFLINSPDKKNVSIPFVPQVISGPALVPAAPSILPADTEMLYSFSLDFLQIHDNIVKTAMAEHEVQRGPIRFGAKVASYESPFAAYEKVLGINIRNDLIPLLGNEIAVSLPMLMFGVPSASGQQSVQEGEKKDDSTARPPSPLVAIAIKDREAVRALIPKIVESIGFKGAGMLAQTERRDDTELVSYGNALAYAFIGDFIVASTDSAAVRHVVDSYLQHQTLASDSHFRNGTRWQSRQLLGQIYISPALMESLKSFGKDFKEPLSEKMQEFLSNLNPAAEPVTYALSNEGFGPLHEVHVPKNLVMLMVAGMSEGAKQTSAETNEAIAQSFLRTISSAEATFQATKGKGRYGSLDELVSEGLLSKEAFDKYGYRIELRVSGAGFEATAIPVEYGKTGKASFFIDESGVMRSGDHAGGPATIADKPQ